MIQYLAGALAGVGNMGAVSGALSDRNKEYQKQSIGHNNMMTARSNEPDMFIAPPGFSLSSFLMNIPQLFSDESVTPVIMDRYDWDRLRGRIVKKSRGEMDIPHSSHSQRLGMMFYQLQQQGLIKLVDYQGYYPIGIQRKNIEQTRALLESISEHENRNAAIGAADGYVDYGFGEYQEPLRRSLDNLDRYEDGRKKVNRQSDKLGRGTNDPVKWNERVLNQYLAALEVSRKLEREMQCDIQCIGQNESVQVASLLSDVPTSELPHSLQYGGSFTDQVTDFDIEDTEKQRAVADQISEIAQSVVGIDNDHWFVYGPRLAMTESGDVYSRARGHIRFKSAESVAEEAHDLLSRLNRRREENVSTEFLNYEAEYVVEDNSSVVNKRRVLDQLRAEAKLTNYSRDIDDVAQGHSPAAKIVVESIATDPMYKHSEDDVFAKTVDMIHMLEPVSLSDEQLESFLWRGNYRVDLEGNYGDRYDWFQGMDRQPVMP